MNVLGNILRGIGHFIDWLLRNFLRLAVVLLIVGVGGYFAIRYTGCDMFKEPIEKSPSAEKASMGVKTDSRIYYFNDHRWDKENDILYLEGYWVFLDGKWRYKDRVLALSDAYGERTTFERR